ncbi:MAG: class I tRNA ligase family protein, partial [Proteobacteria bacterium]|nr:class I tRNA ligase family protein [Pseudomonadota bacterium]
NIASRCAGFINKNFDNRLSSHCSEPVLYKKIHDQGSIIAEHYDNREYARAVREIMELADLANQYIDEKKPWALMKAPETQKEAHDVASTGINLFRLLMIYLKPILPKLAKDVEDFLTIEPLTWDSGKEPLVNHVIKPFKPLMQRVDTDAVQALKEAAKEDIGK